MVWMRIKSGDMINKEITWAAMKTISDIREALRIR